MGAPIPLRPDFDGSVLRRLACASDDADQTRRLLALASIYDGGSRGCAAKLGGVGHGNPVAQARKNDSQENYSCMFPPSSTNIIAVVEP